MWFFEKHFQCPTLWAKWCQTIIIAILFMFWHSKIVLMCMYWHLLSALLIFQSENGVTQVQVRREEHFKNERRIIKMYIGIYVFFFMYDLSVILYTAIDFYFYFNDSIFDMNSATNLGTTIILIIMYVISYLRFRYHTLTKYHDKFKLHWKNWLAIFTITLCSLIIICSYDVLLLKK